MQSQRTLAWLGAVTFGVGLITPLAGAPADTRLRLDFGDLAAQAKEVVNITLDKNTIGWAAKAAVAQGGNEAELRELMKELDGIYVQVLEFDKAQAPPWKELLDLTKGVRSQLDGPGWSPVVSVTERNKGGDEIVRICLRSGASSEPTGLAVFVLNPKEVVLINVAGPVKLDQLARIGAALGQPGMFGPLGGSTGKKATAKAEAKEEKKAAAKAEAREEKKEK